MFITKWSQSLLLQPVEELPQSDGADVELVVYGVPVSKSTEATICTTSRKPTATATHTKSKMSPCARLEVGECEVGFRQAIRTVFSRHGVPLSEP